MEASGPGKERRTSSSKEGDGERAKRDMRKEVFTGNTEDLRERPTQRLKAQLEAEA